MTKLIKSDIFAFNVFRCDLFYYTTKSRSIYRIQLEILACTYTQTKGSIFLNLDCGTPIFGRIYVDLVILGNKEASVCEFSVSGPEKVRTGIFLKKKNNSEMQNTQRMEKIHTVSG